MDFKSIVKNPLSLLKYIRGSKILRVIPDKAYLKLMYRAINGESLNLDSPKTYTEKLNWLKLYDRKPEYTIMVDKYLARDYVAKRIGEKYLVPLIGVWNNTADIDFDSLPDQFVLKCNHNSGTGFCLCKDKNKLDKKEVIKKLNKGLRENFYYKYREWPYKNVPRRIIAEKLMKNTNGKDLVDYKVFCFHGEPKIILINSGRFSSSGTKTDFYDIEWNYLNIQEGGGLYPCAGNVFTKPPVLNELLEIAAMLSNSIPQLRVDFNYWDDKLYFSELTFFHNAGMEPFSPDKWNSILGKYIRV